MAWIDFFRAAEAHDCLLSFDALASVGILPIAIGKDATGKIKDPGVNGAGWGKMEIKQRRQKLVDLIAKKPKEIGLGCQPIGHLVIDIDPPGKDRSKLEEIQAELEAVVFNGNMPATLTIGTQAGRHFWFKAPPDLIKWWGDFGKKKIMLSNGAAADLFLGIASKQTQVAMPPSAGKEIESETDPVELPAHAVEAIKKILSPPQSKQIPAAVVNVPAKSEEEEWFTARAVKIFDSIARAAENTRHDKFRGGLMAIAGYAAGVGCTHLRHWCCEQAKAAHSYAKRDVKPRVLELTAQWAWERGSQWPMLPAWIEKKRSGHDYRPEIEDREQVQQVQPEIDEPGDLAGYDNPHRLARQWLEEQGVNRVVTWQGEFWQWRQGRYDMIPGEEIDALLSVWIDGVFAQHAKEEYFKAETREDRAKVKVKSVEPKTVTAVKKAIAGLTTKQLANIESMPAWLDGVGNGWDVRDVICMKNAMINPRVGAIDNLTSNFFSRFRTNYDWIDDPPKPEKWLAFLKSVWPNDKECIEALQMFFGYCLTQDTRHQKIAMLVGPPRSGKGTIARTLTEVIGPANVASPSLGDLATPFGLAKCIGRPLAIVPDARIGGRSDQAVIVERLLSISGEDRVAIDRKYREAWEGRLPTRLLICSNELPRLQDTTGALTNRYLVMPMSKSFLGNENKNLDREIMEEIPGIVAWAVKGFQKLVKAGKFTQPESGKLRLKVLEELCSPIVAFIQENYQVTSNDDDRVYTNDFHDSWRIWCEKTGHHASSVHKLFKDLTDVYPSVQKRKVRVKGTKDTTAWAYVGIKAIDEKGNS
jgi:P4 family phage/plasmid primase-like protien